MPLDPKVKDICERGVKAASDLTKIMDEAKNAFMDCYISEDEGVEGVHDSFKWILDNPEKFDPCEDLIPEDHPDED